MAITSPSSPTARPTQIRKGRVTSSQFQFHDSLLTERDLGINFWEKKCPVTEGIAFAIPGPDSSRALFWEARLDHYGQSIDQRVKFAGWMEEFARRGGDPVIEDAGVPHLEQFAKSHELVLVAAGKGEIAQRFGSSKTQSTACSSIRCLPERREASSSPGAPL